MILLCMVFLGLAVVVYACTPRMRTPSRLLIAVLVFLIPATAAISWLVIVGDRAPPNSVDVDLNDLNEGN